jgi:hypothetical protein
MYVYKEGQSSTSVTNNCYEYKFGISGRYREHSDGRKTCYHVEAYSHPTVCGTDRKIAGINETGKGADMNIIYPKEYFDQKYIKFKDLTDVIMTIKDAMNDPEFEKIKANAIKDYIDKNKINFANMVCYLYDSAKEPKWDFVKK